MDTQTLITLIAGLIGAFLLGGVPFGWIVGKARGIDIRQHGSKNIGATNVGRVLGRRFGFLVFGLDLLKGLAPALIAGWLLRTLGHLDAPADRAWMWLSIGVCAILGHMFTPFLQFKGGKGVATGFGVVLGVFPVLTVAAVVALVVWIVTVKISRYVSLASCLASIALAITAPLVAPVGVALGVLTKPLAAQPEWVTWPYTIVAAVLAVLVIAKHRANIQRLLSGTENKVGGGRSGQPAKG